MIQDPDTQMFREAAEAPDVVRRQLADNRETLAQLATHLEAEPPTMVLTCARGSSDHAATYLKHLIETRVGLVVASASPSVASLYGGAPAGGRMLTIGLSQSGKSPDLIATMEAAAAAGARTLALVNVAESPLASLADTVLPLRAGPETSVAATKSFLATLVASASLVAAWTGDAALEADLTGLPATMAAAWSCDWSPLVGALGAARGLFVIGRGPGFGAAQEAALKLKETCGLHAEAFSAAEVRHGPMALVGPDLPLLVFRQDDQTAESTDALAADAAANGAAVFVAGGGTPIPAGATLLPLPTVSPQMSPIVAIQAFYRAANALSVRRGFDPDRPCNLRKVTETV